ncbi:MAG: hypothetical protein L3K10_06415 [Thermoplasmata archaeon]|nr:hypothetical protein [Thermoplasmata archaeon]
MAAPARRWEKVAAGAGAFVLGDLIIGFAAFSSISLTSLWMFSWGWIRLHSEFAARGLAFGTPWQLGLAWFGALAALPLLGLTVFLAIRALPLSRRVYYMIRGGVRPVRDTSQSRWLRSQRFAPTARVLPRAGGSDRVARRDSP